MLAVHAVQMASRSIRSGAFGAQKRLGISCIAGDANQQTYINYIAYLQSNKFGMLSIISQFHVSRRITKDRRQAIKWAKRAARQGLVLSQCLLGDLYFWLKRQGNEEP